MEINVTGHNLEVTPAIRNFTEEKLKKLERHFDTIRSINITFDVEKLVQIAEGSIHVNKEGIVHARALSDNLYTAIDEMIDKLNAQLLKHKGKYLDHRDHHD